MTRPSAHLSPSEAKKPLIRVRRSGIHGNGVFATRLIPRGRIWIRAIRITRPGEVLFYDYRSGRDPDDPPDIDEVFACRCGAKKCRGTMLVGRARRKCS